MLVCGQSLHQYYEVCLWDCLEKYYSSLLSSYSSEKHSNEIQLLLGITQNCYAVLMDPSSLLARLKHPL